MRKILKLAICSIILFCMLSCVDDNLGDLKGSAPKDTKEAIYMGVVGFNNAIQVKTIEELNGSTKNNFVSFIENLSFENGNNYEVALEKALDNLEDFNAPQGLDDVTIVSFITGIDDTDRLDLVLKRLKNMRIQGNYINSYVIGCNDDSMTDSEFEDILTNISSSSEKAYKLSNINQLSLTNLTTDINKKLIDSQTYTITIPLQSDNTRIRFCIGEDAYVEGTYSLGNNSDKNIVYLKDIVYKGIVTEEGREIECSKTNSSVSVIFKNLKSSTGDSQILSSKVKVSYYIPVTQGWSEDSNFNSEKNVKVKYNRRSSIILYVVNCNSLIGNADKIKSCFKSSIKQIEENLFTIGWDIIDESQDVTNQGEGTVDITVLKGELQSALYDDKGSVVATSAHGYQYSNANTVDVFAGYTTASRSDFQYGPALSHTYQWPNGYYGAACDAGPTSALYNTYTYAESLRVPEYKAIAQIIYAQTALHAVNNAGCLPYHDNRNLKVSRPLNYLSQEETYNAILDDLDEAISTLKIVQPGKDALIEVEGDSYDKGDATYAYSEYRWEKWVQLANTVKLRIAMYLAKPNSTLAEQVATEALSDEIGVLDEDFGPAYKSGNTQHPYYQISVSNDGGWADSRMNASLENVLKRTGSPLIEKYFKKNLDKVTDKVTGTTTKKDADYYGIRQGTNVGIKTSGQGYYNFSEASVAFKYVRQAWVTKEEVIFLKAEAALRWGLGDKSAKEYYEEGIRSIFAKFDLSSKVDAYLAQKSVVQQKKGGKFYDIDYVDILDAKNNLPGRLNICVAWDESDSDETKLEKIITQKWISIYPNGNEAWVDFRRTGYPRLFPSVQKWSGVPSFPVELQLRRIPHDESDENILLYDLPNIEQALSIFGQPGQNAGGQRLYFEGDPVEYPWTYDENGWFEPKNF